MTFEEFAQRIADMKVYGAETDKDPKDATETLNKLIVRARELTAEAKRAKRPPILPN